MVRTRGGGLSRGRKPCLRTDVPEQTTPPDLRRSKRGRQEDSGGEELILRRSPRRSITTVGGGATGVKAKNLTNRRSGEASRKRVSFDVKEPEPKKSKKSMKPRKSKKQNKVSGSAEAHVSEVENRDKVDVDEARYGHREEDYPSEDERVENVDGDEARDADDEARDADDEAEVRDDGRREEFVEESEEGGFEEQACREVALFFGNETREDNCEINEDSGDDVFDEDKFPEDKSSDEENEENGWLGEPYREDVDPEELLKLGKLFSDVDDFKHACLRYTLKTRYNIKYYRSESFKIGAKCASTPKKDGALCPWKIYCAFERSKMKLQIKMYVNVHTCERTGDSKILKRSPIASLFSERLRVKPKMTAKEIAAEIRREYQMNVSENSCSKAKTKLMTERKRTHEEHFDRIWDYQAEVLKQNPGSTFDIETIPGPTITSKQRFYRLYLCFEAQKLSWKRTCRPVIGVDGAFLKWDIKGQLLAAVGRDGDNKIVPIAWAVVEIENETNWEWFLKHLASDLELGYGDKFVILSDKQKGLVKAIQTVIPDAEHRQCCRHIYENWRKGSQDLQLQKLLWWIARSYTEGTFNYNMDELKKYNALAYDALLKTHPETWARAYFRLGSFCNDNLNNLSESFNRTIREARKKPLLDLLEDIRQQCMTRNYNRYKIASRLLTEFTKKTHRELDRVEKKSKECELHWAIGPDVEVRYKGHGFVVNVEQQTCACRGWQMNGIPCIHAATVIHALDKKLSEFVAPCYLTTTWQETYKYGIKPINGMLEWPVTGRLGVLPPPIRTGNRGRPKNHDRCKGKNETANKKNETKLDRSNRVMTCSNCKKEGHNKTTCKNEFVAEPPRKPAGRPKKDKGQQFQESQGSQQQCSFSQASPWEVPQASQGSQDQSSHATNSQWEQISKDRSIHNRGWGSWFD